MSDCRETARGGAGGVNGAAFMAVPWSVWDSGEGRTPSYEML